MLRPLIRPLVRPLTRRVTDPAWGWSPRVLFSGGEQGAWYDPSDLSTLYQDAPGTTPVTALGQPVGLMLDKSKGLVRGPELYSGGTSIGGTGYATKSGDTWSLYRDVGGTGTVALTASARPGTSYLVTLTAYPTGSGAQHYADIRGGSSGGGHTSLFPTITGEAMQVSGIVRTGATSTEIICTNPSVNSSWSFDNVSVRELPGNHASQSTATARPTLQAGNKIDFDGVDDKLTTTFPDLGTAVTIVRSVPGTGASILTGQTIGAGARDDSTDHHGLLIINRALTAPETALVTRWANMRAGV